MRSISLGVIGWFVILLPALFPLRAGGQTNSLSLPNRVISSSTVAPVDVNVTLEHTLTSLSSFSFGVQPETPLSVIDASYVGPIPAQDADFINVELQPGGGVTFAAIFFDPMGIFMFPPDAYAVGELTIDVAGLPASESRSLDFRGDLGSPPIVIEFGAIPGVTIPEAQITLSHGSIARSMAPPPAEIGSFLWIPLAPSGSVARVETAGLTILDTFGGFWSPTSVAVDPTGTAWVTDSVSGEVLRFAPSGGGSVLIPPAIAIGGNPSAVTIDRNRNVWIADSTAQTVIELNESGDVIVGPGADRPAVPLLGAPVGLAIDLKENLWVATESSHTLTKISPTGDVALEVSLLMPVASLAIDRKGFLWTTTPLIASVERRTSDGSVAETWTLPGGSEPTHLAIRSESSLVEGRETWVTGRNGGGGGGFWRLRPGGVADFFDASIPDPPTGIALDGRGRVWGMSPAGDALVGVDPSTGSSLQVTGLAPGDGFVGDATGYVQADTLHPGVRVATPFTDLDGDDLRNSDELTIGSDVFDDGSGAPPGFVPPVAVLTAQVSMGSVSIEWTNGLSTYDSIRIERISTAGGSVIVAPALAGTATSYVDGGVPTGTYRYSVVALLGGVESEAREAVVTVGPGQLISVTTVDVGGSAANLTDLAHVPGSDPTDPDSIVFYATDGATRLVYGLNSSFDVLSTLPDPFGGTVSTLSGVAVDPDGDMGAPSIFVAGGGFGQQYAIREVALTGEPLGEWLVTENDVPVTGTPAGLTFSEGTDLLLVVGPIGCNVFAIARESKGEIDAGLSFQHPTPGFALNGIDIPPGASYGAAGGFVALTRAAPPVLPGAEVEYAIATYSFATGGATPVEVSAIPLTVLDLETALGGFAFGETLGVIGVTTSSIYELLLPLAFIRGDCNGDGNADISDAVSTLGILFLGQPSSCDAACDCNDDEATDISDPVYLLNHLFAFGPPLPPPFAICDVDPTPGPSCDDYVCP